VAAALQTQFERVRELDRRQVVADERERLLRDMHDAQREACGQPIGDRCAPPAMSRACSQRSRPRMPPLTLVARREQ